MNPSFDPAFADLNVFSKEYYNRWLNPGDERKTNIPVIPSQDLIRNIGKENIEKVMIHYSVGNGYYFTMAGKAVLDQHFLDNVKTRMQELADMCTPIGKRSVNTDDAVSLFLSS